MKSIALFLLITVVNLTSLLAQGFGNALTFTANGDYVEAAAPDLLSEVDQFTIEVWAKFDAVGGFGVIVGKVINTGNRVDLQFATNGQLLGVINNTFGATPTVLTAGRWYHLAYVFDGTESVQAERLKLYINGQQETLFFTGTIPAMTPSSTAPIRVGKFDASTSFQSQGTYDELRIWSVPRTLTEIQASMNTVLSGSENGLEAYYKFDQTGSSTALTDHSPNSYDGTLINFSGTPWVASEASLSGSISSGGGFDFSRGETNDNFDAGAYQPDFVYTSNEGSNFTNSGSQMGSQFRFRLLSENSLGAVTSVPSQEDNTPWIQDSWRSAGTNGQPVSVGQVWAIYTREDNYAVMQISTVTGSSFSFSYKYQPDGSPSFGSSPSITNYAIDFDASSNSFIELANPTSFNFGTGDFTMEMMIYPENLNATQVLISDWNGGTGAMGLATTSGGGLAAWIGGSNFDVQTASGQVTLNQWNHIALARDGNNARLYVNGSEKATSMGLNGRIVSSAEQMNLGRQPSGNPFHFDGKMDEVRIWNVARTTQQINDNQDNTLVGDESGLIAYYQFSDGPGNAEATDNSSNNNTATFNNINSTTGWVDGIALQEPPPCSAGDFVGGSQTWDDLANWCEGVVPSIADLTNDLVISDNVTLSETSDFVLNGANFTVENGVELTIDLTSNTLDLQNGASFINNGTLILADGTQVTDPSGGFTNNGILKGSGTFNNNFNNPASGTVAPGLSPGCTNFGADFTNSGILEIEIDGVATACTDYDQIIVTGTANLGGTLDVILGVGYTPADGDEIVIVDAGTLLGTFTTVNLPDANWTLNYNAPNTGEVSLSYDTPSAGNLIAGSATSTTGTGFDFSREETGDNNDAGDYQLDFAFVSNEGVNFGNEGSSSLTTTGRRFLLLSEPNLDAVTSVPTRVDASPWVTVSYDDTDGTGMLPISVGQVWAVYTREGNYAAMEITSLPGGGFGSSFTFDYKYQPDGGAFFVPLPNFFEDFSGGDIPASWSTSASVGWEDNPVFGFEGEQGAAKINGGSTGRFLQTPLIEDATEFSFYFRAQNAGGDGAQFEVQSSTDGTNFTTITSDGTFEDTYEQYTHTFSSTFTGYIRISSLGLGDQNIIIDNFASDGTEVIVDNTAPVVSDASVELIAPDLEGEVTVDETGTLYYAVYSTLVGDGGPADADDLKTAIVGFTIPIAGSIAIDDAGQPLSFTASSVTPNFIFAGVDYNVYYMAEDAAGNQSTITEFLNVTTTEPVGLAINTPMADDQLFFGDMLEVDFTPSGIADGETVTFELSTDGGSTFPFQLRSNPLSSFESGPDYFFDYTLDNPAFISSQVVLRATLGGEELDRSDQFSISSPSFSNLTINFPVGGNLIYDEAATVSFTNSGFSSFDINILRPGLTPLQVVDNEPTGGANLVEYEFTPELIATNARVQLVAGGNNLTSGFFDIVYPIQTLDSEDNPLTSLDFGVVDVADDDPVLSYDLEVKDIAVVVTSTLPEFTVSTSPTTGFTNTLNIPTDPGFNITAIYVKFSQNDNGGDILSGEIQNTFIDSNTDPITQSVAVIGREATGAPLIVLTNPEMGDEFVSNQVININWTSNLVDLLQVEYSLDGGMNWNLIADNLADDITNFDWLVPAVSSNTTANLRIVDQATSTPATTQEVAFTILPAPSISTISLINSDTQLQIDGTGFSSMAGDNEVVFPGFPEISAFPNTATTTQLVVDLPEGAVSGFITLNVTDKGTAISPDQLVLDGISVSPLQGQVGQTIFVNASGGVDFQTGTPSIAVSFDNNGSPVAATELTVISAEVLSLIIPEGTAGQDNITVEVGGTLYVSPQPFSVQSFSFSPETAGVFQQVTITGVNTNFLNNNARVFVNGVEATSKSIISDTQINFTVPQGANTGRVSVSTDNGFFESTGDLTVDFHKIASLSATKAGRGTLVTINGSNFNSISNAGGVKVNGVTLSNTSFPFITNYTAQDANTITFTVPNTAEGTGKVVVVQGGVEVESPEDFTIIPRITSFFPSQAAPGAEVTISGSYFSDTDNTVYFEDNVPAAIVSQNSFSITVTVPENAADGSLRVVNNDAFEEGESTSSFDAVPAPEFTSFAPLQASAGEVVTITGTNLSIPNATSVRFNEQSLSFSVVNDNTITFTVPTNLHGIGNLDLTKGALTVEGPALFTVVPKVNSFTLATGAVVGATVQINGNGFNPTSGSNTVTFAGGVTAEIINGNNTFLTVVVPAGAVTGPLSVTNNAIGQTGTSTTDFIIVPAAEITDFAPASGQINKTLITVTGQNFSSPNPMFVLFNGTSATFNVISDTEITATVPSITANGPITIERAGGVTTSATNFAIAPDITGLSATTLASGASLTLSGTYLSNADQVQIGAVNATITSNANFNQITVTIPDMTAGTYDVTIFKEGLQDVADQQLEVVPPHTIVTFPQVVDLGEQITITGTNLDAPTPSLVAIDGGLAQVVSSTITELVVNVPTGMTNRGQGKVDIVRAGLTVTSADDMFIRHAITTDFSTTNYVVDQQVTISGSNFRFPDVSGITINGAAATFSISNDNSLTVTIPDAVGTGGSVVITKPAPVGAITAATSIDIVPRAVLSGISPAIEEVGNTITISGLNFTGPDVSAVAINGRTATFSVVNATEITATVPTNLNIFPNFNFATLIQGEVVITRAGLTESTTGDAFTVKQTITGVSPSTVAIGGQLSVSGTFFTNPTSEVAITDGGADIPITTLDHNLSVSFNNLSFEVPTGTSLGANTIETERVNATDGLVTSSPFTVVGAHTVTDTTLLGGWAARGESIILTGTNFDNSPQVLVGTTNATITDNSSTSITFTVPSNITLGQRIITVSRAGLDVNQLASESTDLNFYIKPTISTGISADPYVTGQLITVSGSNLAGIDVVTVDDVSVPVTNSSDVSITFRLTNQSLAALPIGTFDVKLINTDPATDLVLTLPQQITIDDQATIAGITEDTAPVGGLITITGAGFTDPDVSSVTVNGRSYSSFTVVDDNNITLEIENLTGAFANTNNIVLTRGGLNITGSDAFFVAHQIDGFRDENALSFNPSTDRVVEGQTIFVDGNYFESSAVVTGVTVNGITAIFTFQNDDRLQVTIPDGSAGIGKVAVTRRGLEIESAQALVISAPPALTTITPDARIAGATISIQGSNLALPDVETVTVNGEAASFSVINGGNITATVPAGALATGQVTVTTNGVTSGGLPFNVVPRIFSFTNSALVASSIIINGSHFGSTTGTNQVFFSSASGTDLLATVSDASADVLTVTVPTGVVTGSVRVVNTASSQEATSSANFNVLADPVNFSLDRLSGPVASAFTISGDNLNGVTAVSVNDIPATTFDVEPDGTSIQVIVPNAATTGDVVIAKSGLDFNTGQAFSVTPKVLSFPSVATVGSEIRINGKTLTDATLVTVNGDPAPIQSGSSEFVNVLLGVDNVGTSNIEITTPSGSGTSTSTIEVKDAPAITSFTPITGTEGDQVTIIGTDLSTVTFVRFDGITASFNIISDTEILATVPNTETGTISLGLSGVEEFSVEDFQYIKSENDPPAITSATATIVDAGFNGNVTADKAGTVYYVALTDGQPAPSDAQIKNAAIGGLTLTGQTSNGTAVVATAFVGVDFTGTGTFMLGQSYDFYFVMEDLDLNSSDVFTLEDITPVPELTLNAPNGGQNLVVGTATNITWTSVNIPLTDEIDILVSTDGVAGTFNSILTTAETFESLNGTFSWTVPNTFSTEAFIRVRSVTNSLEDESNAAFAIVPVPVIDIAGANTTTGVEVEDADAEDLEDSEETYTVSGTSLLGPVTLTIVPDDATGFEISTDGTNFGTTASVAAGTTATIRVRATNTTNNGRTYEGSILHTSPNAAEINIPVEITELLEVSTLAITSPQPDTLVSGQGIIPLRWTTANLGTEPVEVSYRLVGEDAFASPQASTSNAAALDFSVENLETGDYEIRILTTQLESNVGDTLTFGVDRTPPAVSVDTIIARTGIPALTGTVDDTFAAVTVQLVGFDPVYTAQVNVDATWIVAEGTIEPPLGDGGYDVLVTATDTLGNSATDTTTFELTISFEAVAYEAAEVKPFSFVANWKSGADLSGYELQVARDADFTQLLDGLDNVLVEDTFRLVDSEALYHRESYFYRMRLAYAQGEVSEYSNVIQVSLPESSELLADSTALAELYEATDGANWDDATGWFQDNRFDWAGVTFDGRRITALDLSANDLLGDASEVSMGSLSALTSLDLSDNDLTGLGDLGSSASLQSVDLSGNQLDFGDFQNQSNTSVFNFSDQQPPLEEEVAILAENDPYTFDRAIGGVGNTYSWFKVSDADFTQTGPVFTDDQISFEDQGEYFAEVRNGQFSDIVLTTTSIKIFVSSLEQDSLALAALYENNGGQDWQGVTGWTTSPITQWSNITITGNRVTRIELPGVGVTGNIPTEFATLSAVSYIDLSNNEIDGLPDFTVMENLETLLVDNNSLEFDAILKNLELVSFNFENQAKITVEVEERIREGLDFRLAIDVDGRDLAYQWYFNGEAIPGADSTVYNIIDIDFDQMGDYRCDIQNATVSAAVPGFTLSTGDFEILAIADLGGTIRTLANQPLDEGEATLYRVRELGTPYDSITSVPVVNGSYNFEGAILGDYLVRVRADIETYFPTYVEAAATWSLADTVMLRRDDNEQYDGFVFFQPPPRFPGPDNPNEIVGIVEIDDDDFSASGRSEARRRVRRAGCAFNRALAVNRGEDDVIFELIDYVETDENGQFRVPDLPDGLYRINIEFPGIPMDPNSFIEFELGTGENVEAETLQLAAQIKPTGIVVEKVETTAVFKEYFEEFSIFPNPAREVLNVTYKHLNKTGLEWQIINLQGQQILNGQVPSGLDQSFQLDIARLVDGIYLLNIVDPDIHSDNRVTTVRFMVRK